MELILPLLTLTPALTWDGNLSLAKGARNQVGIGLSYRPASLCSLATQLQTRFLESIPRPIAGLKIPTLAAKQQSTTIDGPKDISPMAGMLKKKHLSYPYPD